MPHTPTRSRSHSRRPFHRPSPAALTIALFGLTALISGLMTLISPSTFFPIPPPTTLPPTNLPTNLRPPPPTQSSPCLPSIYGNGLAATAMGLYYLLAAWQENRLFFLATVPMRVVSGVVFWRVGLRGVGVWEGGGAVLTVGVMVMGG